MNVVINEQVLIMNEIANIENNHATKNTDTIATAFVEPSILALHLAYFLFSGGQSMVQISQRELKQTVLALNVHFLTEHSVGDEKARDNSIAPSLSDAYISHLSYELEKCQVYFIKLNKRYLLMPMASVNTVEKLSVDAQALVKFSDQEIRSKFNALLDNAKKGTKQSTILDNKLISDDKQVILRDIWDTLIAWVKEKGYSENNEDALITYQQLAQRSRYQLHRNGLANYLYSIEVACKDKDLPSLDSLVVKQDKRLPEKIDPMDTAKINEFKTTLKDIIEYVKSDMYDGDYVNTLEYRHKPRPKKR